MAHSNRTHWDEIYTLKSGEACSWYQPYPATSMECIAACGLPKEARIIDIGGGDSLLVDALLREGFTAITVLDISAAAIDRAKARLGERASGIDWVVCDVNDYVPEPGQYDLWHDRAAFHFLTDDAQVRRYAAMAQAAVRSGGSLILGAFSTKGPKKCSGLDVRQYTRSAMCAAFAPGFRRIDCRDDVHTTPFQTTQEFLYCRFKRLQPQSM